MDQFRVVVTPHPRAEGEVRRLETLLDTGAGYTPVAQVEVECTHRLHAMELTADTGML